MEAAEDVDILSRLSEDDDMIDGHDYEQLFSKAIAYTEDKDI